MSSKSDEHVIEPYHVACVQACFNNYNPDLRGEFPNHLKEYNLQLMCDYIDATFNVGAFPPPVRLFCFPEFSIGGLYNTQTMVEEVKKYQAITIPGPETEVLAAKAREHNIYIAASNHENDPSIPDYYFNTAFIINPEGKIILKYRKLNTAFACSPHDVYSEYVNPITGTSNFFPVVETELGRLACFICGDLGIPEIPRIYASKGADVLMHLSSGYAWELALQKLRVRADDNTIYIVNENWAARVLTNARVNDRDLVVSIDSRDGGGCMVIDYNGQVVSQANGTAPQLIFGEIDVMKLREERKRWKSPAHNHGNFLANTRTELYRPFYESTIFPPDDILRLGKMTHLTDEGMKQRKQTALENLTRLYDYYSESDVA